MAGLPGSPSVGSDPDAMGEYEKSLADEIIKLKEKLKAARLEVANTDFFKMTEKLKEIGRVKIKDRKHLRGHLAKVTDLRWGQDSQLAVSAAQDGNLIVWDTFGPNKLFMINLQNQWVFACEFFPKMDYVVSGGLDNLITLHSLKGREGPTAEQVKQISGHNGYISCIRSIDYENLLTCSGDKTTILWDVESSKPKITFHGHANDVTSMALPKNDVKNTFVSVSTDKTCRVWDIRTGKCTQYFDGHEQDVNGVDYFPESSFGFATSSDDGSCRLWDLRADQAIAVYIDEFVQSGSTTVALSKSGRLLLAGYDDFNCHIWDLLREERVGIMSGHDGRVSKVAISENGIGVASASWDKTCTVWSSKF